LVIKGHLVGSHVSWIAGKRQFSANPDIVDRLIRRNGRIKSG
jgi:hypothetical protein